MSVDIEKYLDEEGILVRTWEEVYQEIQKHRSENFALDMERVLSSDDETEPEKFYDKVAQQINGFALYDYLLGRNRVITQESMRKIIDFIPKEGIENVLDLCTGTGLYACLIGEKYPKARIIGTDISTEMIQRARERAVRRKLTNTSFIIGNRDQIDFNNGHFDLITCINGITEGDNYGNPMQYELIKGMTLTDRFENIRSKLKTEGHFIVSVPLGRFNPGQESEEYLRNLREMQEDYMEAYLVRSGFTRVEKTFVEKTNKEKVSIIDMIFKAKS